MTGMKALFHKEDGLWEISHGDRWWTATNSTEHAYIVSDRGTVIEPGSRLGLRITAAIAKEVGND